MKTMNREDYIETLQAQSVPRDHFAFRCPMCNTVQSAIDLINAEAGPDFEGVERYLAFTCVGRFTGAGSPRQEKDQGRGCNWTLGGLFQTHKLEVITEDGTHHPRFEPVTAEEAQAHKERFANVR